MPDNYRGDIIFVSDSQQFKNKNHMISEFGNYWGPHFYPNTVFYQIGYPDDKDNWNSFDNPIKMWGTSIANSQKQKVGIFWVDFTLKDVVKSFKKNGDFIVGTKIYDHNGDMNILFEEFKKAGINTLFSSTTLNGNPEFRKFSKEYGMKRFLIFPTFYAPEYLQKNLDHYLYGVPKKKIPAEVSSFLYGLLNR